MRSEVEFKLISYAQRQPLPDPTERRLLTAPGVPKTSGSYVERLALWVSEQPDAPVLRGLLAVLLEQPEAFAEAVVHGTVTIVVTPSEAAPG